MGLKWAGNIRAMEEADIAVQRLKPKKKNRRLSKKKRQRLHHIEVEKRKFWSKYNKYMKSKEWFAKRQEALDAAGNQCYRCNSVLNLRVHHTTYERLGYEYLGDLEVLCEGCHKMLHPRMK